MTDISSQTSAQTDRAFSMSELVERSGVAAATIRYYLNAGLLPPPERVSSNRFLYDERHVELVRLIKLLRDRRSMSLEAIGRLVPELLPDLHGHRDTVVFRPEMWGQLLRADSSRATVSTSSRLVEEGLAAFARNGYAEVSIDDVCRAVGIAKGSFYRHFPSKEALFFAASRLAATRVADGFTRAASDTRFSPDAASRVLASELVSYVTVLLDLSSLASRREPAYASVWRESLGLILEAVTAGCDATSPGEVHGIVDAALGRAIALAVG